MAKAGKDENILTVLAFARKLGCSHTAVNTAISEGFIKDGYDRVAKRISYDTAMLEWGTAFLEKRAAKSKIEIRGITTNGNISISGGGDKETAAAGTGGKSEADKGQGAADGKKGAWTGGEIPADASYPEALRITQVLKAQEQQRKNDEEMGLLLPKVKVDMQLMTAGLEIRKGIERLPQLCVDKVRAADTRADAITAMEQEVRGVLEKIADAIRKALGNENGSMAE